MTHISRLTPLLGCAYHLAAHSLLMDIIMLREHNAFAVMYCHCIQALQSHLQLSLYLHYREEAYMIGLCICCEEDTSTRMVIVVSPYTTVVY